MSAPLAIACASVAAWAGVVAISDTRRTCAAVSVGALAIAPADNDTRGGGIIVAAVRSVRMDTRRGSVAVAIISWRVAITSNEYCNFVPHRSMLSSATAEGGASHIASVSMSTVARDGYAMDSASAMVHSIARCGALVQSARMSARWLISQYDLPHPA